jgi:hypothetical protein
VSHKINQNFIIKACDGVHFTEYRIQLLWLHCRFSWKSNDRASFEIAGFDPQEFAETFAYLEGRNLFTVEDEDDDGIDAW